MIIIDKLHKYFETSFELSQIDSIKLKYSLELVMGEISKFFILFFLFWVLGKATDFIYSLLTLMIIRVFTGGLHFKHYSNCIIFSGFFFYISIFLKNYFHLNPFSIIAMYILSLFIIIIFAPVFGKSRPNYSYKKKHQLIHQLLEYISHKLAIAFFHIHFLDYPLI